MEKRGKDMLFKIGEFSRYMGVTPDFLKHYEQFRLVEPVIAENGYRYYPFRESSKILECMRLHGYGLSLREMDAMLNDDDLPAVREKLDARTGEIARRLAFDQAVLEDYRRLSAWMDRMGGRSWDWRVEDGEEMVFLPQTKRREFSQDERIHALLKSWVRWMPVIKSALLVPHPQADDPDEEAGGGEYSWGLIAPKRLIEDFSLPVNDVVIPLPKHKLFFYDFIGRSSTRGTDAIYFPRSQALAKLAQLGLKPAGGMCKVVLLYTHMNKEPAFTQYGYLAIPIETE